MGMKNVKSYLPLSIKQWIQVLLIVVIAGMVGLTGKMSGLFGKLRGRV